MTHALSSECKILIVEDEPLIAEHIATYLNNADFMVSGIAYDVDEARQLLRTSSPDAVILDINLDGETDGIQLAEFINKNYQLPFLFLTSYADRDTLERAKKVEPWGYIVKPFNEKTLQATLEIAISNFAQRANQLAPGIQLEKLNRHLSTPITPREFEVLQLIYEGQTNRQIAGTLFVSTNTVKRHINNAYLALEATSRSTAIARLRELMLK
ncbi:MAG TPA: response regulator transcription factor [Saprospiraceae bacterium]|nr:response regulator transcription factor [Saprospiraceae bacterium]HNT19681.1 response regulator transcription factor [Saprospiraceae bacterium]